MSWETFWQIMALMAWATVLTRAIIRDIKTPYRERRKPDDKS